MYFAIIDNKWKCLWATGRTDGKQGSISFPEICKYLLSANDPEIFILNLYDGETGEVVKRVPLTEYEEYIV